MRLFLRLPSRLLLLGLASALAACSWQKKETNLNGDSVKVQIPFAVDGNYRLDVIELFTLNTVRSLKGLAAQFLMDPETKSGRLNGRAPEIRYIRDQDGVIVAKDILSLQLLSVYAHFEKLKLLDEKLGAGGLLHYPRTVAVNVQYTTQSGGVEENNALYSGQFDALFVEPYTKENLPLMANAGVLAHEHFHALFQKLVVEPLKEKYPNPSRATGHDQMRVFAMMGLAAPSEISQGTDSIAGPTDPRSRYHAALLRGVNEGLADAWGWVYSGDTIFVGRSLPQEKVRRDLEITPDGLYSSSELLSAVNAGASDDQLLRLSYLHGTQLARTIRNFGKIYAMDKNISLAEARSVIGQTLVATLPEIKKQFEALPDNEYFSLSSVVQIFSEQVKDLDSQGCNFLAKLMPGDPNEANVDLQNTSKIKLVGRCRELQIKVNP